MRRAIVNLLIDYPPEHPYRRATLAALQDASDQASIQADVRIVPTDTIDDPEKLAAPGAAVFIGPGTPYRDPEAANRVIRSARERGVPLVATWGGFQHVLVEHARNLAGITDASHAEYGAGGRPVITLLACSLLDQTITVDLAPDSLLSRLYGRTRAVERTTCSYGLAPDVQHIAGEYGMRTVATDETGEVRAIERVDHRFFVGTLYQPQLTSSPGAAHPIFVGLLKATVG